MLTILNYLIQYKQLLFIRKSINLELLKQGEYLEFGAINGR